MGSHSMTDVAFEILENSEGPVPFKVLWDEVRQQLGFDETKAMRKIGSFYESLSLDTRFTSKDNNWDLSKRHKFAETHIDISAIEIDDDAKSDYDSEDFVEDEEDTSTENYDQENEEEDIY